MDLSFLLADNGYSGHVWRMVKLVRVFAESTCDFFGLITHWLI